MTPSEWAYKIVCDAFGSESGWEHVTAWIAEAVSGAVAAERERCAAAAEGVAAGLRGKALEAESAGFALRAMCEMDGALLVAARIRQGDETCETR